MFIRRLYYNPETGEILHSYMMQGAIKPIAETASQEAARLGLENWAVFEWHEPDPEIEQNFVDSYDRVSVDMESGELVFDFSPLPEPEPTEYEQYYNAVASELGGI